jgi:hypothetical protein
MMTNYNDWGKYDVSKELDTLSDRDRLDDILAPYKKMLKDSYVNENELRAELSKFAKSMKSLVGGPSFENMIVLLWSLM